MNSSGITYAVWAEIAPTVISTRERCLEYSKITSPIRACFFSFSPNMNWVEAENKCLRCSKNAPCTGHGLLSNVPA